MGRLALVTGGTKGIGKAIAITLKKHGYSVVVNYAHDETAAKAFKDETKIEAYKWNVANFSDCKKGVDKIIKDFGKTPEILVNNAGIIKDAMLHKQSEENWHKVINTNLDSCFNMCRHVVPFMREEGFGRIVNISSINALTGQVGQTNYSAAKAGMIGFTKALAREGASKGITINTIAPGYIKTDMTDAVPHNFIQDLIRQIPVGRLGRPEEIARAVVFLIADEAGFLTGETLSINGGQYMS